MMARSRPPPDPEPVRKLPRAVCCPDVRSGSERSEPAARGCRFRLALYAAPEAPPLHEAGLEILPGPESQQPPDDQPRDLQVVHAISQGTAAGRSRLGRTIPSESRGGQGRAARGLLWSVAEALILGPGIIGGVLMGIIAWLLVGLIAGWLAGMAMGGRGFGVLGNIVVGVVGALIGGFLGSTFFGWDVDRLQRRQHPARVPRCRRAAC